METVIITIATGVLIANAICATLTLGLAAAELCQDCCRRRRRGLAA